MRKECECNKATSLGNTFFIFLLLQQTFYAFVTLPLPGASTRGEKKMALSRMTFIEVVERGWTGGQRVMAAP